MLAKITAKNQLTLPKSLTQALGPVEYFDVQARDGQLVLTPVHIQRGDAVRAKLAELGLTEADIGEAIDWARAAPAQGRRAKPVARSVTKAPAKAGVQVRRKA